MSIREGSKGTNDPYTDKYDAVFGSKCVWCGMRHKSGLKLCPECEEEAKRMKARS